MIRCLISYLWPHLSGRVSANKVNKIYILVALMQRFSLDKHFLYQQMKVRLTA